MRTTITRTIAALAVSVGIGVAGASAANAMSLVEPKPPKLGCETGHTPPSGLTLVTPSVR